MTVASCVFTSLRSVQELPILEVAAIAEKGVGPPGTVAVQAPCNADSLHNGFQRWVFMNGGPYQIRNAATVRCVDDSAQYGLRSLTCYQASYDNGFQKWVQIVWA